MLWNHLWSAGAGLWALALTSGPLLPWYPSRDIKGQTYSQISHPGIEFTICVKNRIENWRDKYGCQERQQTFASTKGTAAHQTGARTASSRSWGHNRWNRRLLYPCPEELYRNWNIGTGCKKTYISPYSDLLYTNKLVCHDLLLVAYRTCLPFGQDLPTCLHIVSYLHRRLHCYWVSNLPDMLRLVPGLVARGQRSQFKRSTVS